MTLWPLAPQHRQNRAHRNEQGGGGLGDGGGIGLQAAERARLEVVAVQEGEVVVGDVNCAVVVEIAVEPTCAHAVETVEEVEIIVGDVHDAIEGRIALPGVLDGDLLARGVILISQRGGDERVRLVIGLRLARRDAQARIPLGVRAAPRRRSTVA